MQILNFGLHKILNFKILSNKILLVSNFFLNLNRRYDKYLRNFQLQITVKIISDIGTTFDFFQNSIYIYELNLVL